MTPLIERLMAKVEKDPGTGCWLWLGALLPNGYGTLSRGRRGEGLTTAHRAAFEHFVGPIPDGHDLDHLCRVRRCVNPAHLEPVTRSENNRRGLRGSRRLVCPNGHWVLGNNRDAAGRCRSCRRIEGRAA